jgi:hypothetical protein
VRNLRIRLLLADTSRPMALPCRRDDLADDPDFRARAGRITARSATALRDAVDELRQLGRLDAATVAVRVHDATPLFKLYIVNGEEAFFGLYPIREHAIDLGGQERVILDLMGKDAAMFRFGPGGTSAFVAQATDWFARMWESLGREAVL